MRYSVKPGDTLGSIAQQFGTTWQELQQLNPDITDPDNIYPGQALEVPDGSAAQPEPVQPSAPPVGGVALEQLQSIMPNLDDGTAAAYLPYLNAAMAEAAINTCLRQAAFLAQLAHESGEFRYMEELADGWEYEDREDLGNVYEGDGPRYKGRGPIQLTGRANYIAAGEALGIDLVDNPERAADPDVGFRTACWYWNTHDLNSWADVGDQDSFDAITFAINGGYNGKDSRDAYYWRARGVLGCP